MQNHQEWIHPQLRADCFSVHSFVRCEILLMNDARWPWLILVPRGGNFVEIQDLDESMRRDVFDEVNRAGQIIQQLFSPKKINTAALGNMVPQLHIHVIGRFENDAAWPKPVWGVGIRQPYDDPAAMVQRIKNAILGLKG